MGDDDLRGSAYVFENRLGSWTEVAKLVAPDGSEAQAFGSSVALDGTVAVVGAPLEGAGSAYVYERIAGTWVETAELTAGASELFGYRVAVADPWLFVSLHVDSTVTPDGGSVYAYRRENGGWQLAEILRAADASAGHVFGVTLSALGNRLAVAALEVTTLGSVYVFEHGPSGWIEVAKLAGPSDTHATGFGRGLDLAPNALHVGAYEGDGTPASPGANYVFEPLLPPQVYTYCESEPNSAGAGAQIGKTGTTRIGRNDFRLTTTGLPPDGFALFFYGGDQVNVPFRDGRLCVAPGVEGLFRLDPPTAIDGLGETTRWLDFTDPAAAAIEAGSSWNFQCWYRDAAMGASGFNFSDGLSARFCP